MSKKAKVWYRKGKGWRVGLYWQGKQYEFGTFENVSLSKYKELAEEVALRINADIAAGTFNPLYYKTSKPLHLKNYSQKWLEQIKPLVSYPTYKDYNNSLKNYINPVLGDDYLPNINYERLIHLFNKISEGVNKKKRGIKGKKNIFGCLHKLMVDARKVGHIKQLPEWIEFKGANAVPQKAIEWIDQKTQKKILEKIPKKDRFIFKFLMATGVRPSEARAFRWKDIKEDHILIRKTFRPVKGGEELFVVKQKRERRVEMYEDLKTVLKEVPRNLTPYVFLDSRTHRPYTKNINRDYWNPACDKVGIKINLNNACRHSFGNQLAQAGIDMHTISELMGHSNPAITKKHYATSSRKILKNVVDNVRQLRPNYDSKKKGKNK